MAKVPIGLQLFSVRGECQENLAATLRSVADCGYVGVEPWGYGGDGLDWMAMSAAEIRELCDELALRVCGLHLMTRALQGDRLPVTIEFNRILGNKFLIVAADKPRMATREGIMELAGILNETADRLKPYGMATGYHAHAFDFETVDGEIAWDILFGNTVREVVMQMDIGNCAGGGGDPYGTLAKFPGRARSVHLKDYGGGPDAVIGEGQANWPEVWRLCDTLHPVEWYVVEEGHEGGYGFDIPRRSLAALRAMGR